MTDAASPRRWVDHAVALFVTLHLAAVVVHLIPRPPRVDAAALANPNVSQEVDLTVDLVHRWTGYSGTHDELEQQLIRGVRSYMRLHARYTAIPTAYLRAINSTQSWNMFGGSANTAPAAMHIDVLPRGESEWVRMQDGVAAGTAIVHRQRKAQGNLGPTYGKRAPRRPYAAWCARQWARAHPNRPVDKVRLTVVRGRTPAPAAHRSGATPQWRPVLVFDWEAP